MPYQDARPLRSYPFQLAACCWKPVGVSLDPQKISILPVSVGMLAHSEHMMARFT
jgi:hypothetical protein